MSAKPNFVTVSNGNLELFLCPGAGGSVAAFRLNRGKRSVDLFRPYDPALPAEALNMASFPLMPYSNRIINCALRFRGQVFKAGPPFRPEPHQLHGDAWRLPWQVVTAGASRAVLELKTRKRADFPWAYAARQEFALSARRLTISLSITNLSGRALPFGLGHHPYFPRNKRTVLKAKLPRVWESRNIVPQRIIPVPRCWDFSQGLALADAHFWPPEQGFNGGALLDHCFAGWDGKARVTWPDRGVSLSMGAEKPFRHFVIYIPPRADFFCAEPVTHCIDGFNLMEKGVHGTGSIVLASGETLTGEIWFDVGPGGGDPGESRA
jgi:aldose 1-epimerase